MGEPRLLSRPTKLGEAMRVKVRDVGWCAEEGLAWGTGQGVLGIEMV